MKSVLIVAGENSGDRHGADFVHEFKKRHPDVSFFGIGGRRLAEEGVEIICPVEKLSAVGIFEVLTRIPHFRRIFNLVKRETQARNPRAAVLIDSPDFNLRLARMLGKTATPVLYYISPTVWAWRKSRLKTIRKVVTRMCLIFPFEKKLYEDNRIPASFVGHPLKGRVGTRLSRDEFLAKYSLPAEVRLITLLPGSRPVEVKNHLPVLAEAVPMLQAELSVRFLLVQAESIPSGLLDRYLPSGKPDIRVLTEDGHEAVAYSDLVLSSCGTANLETALLGTPLIAFYRLSPFTYYPFRHLVKVREYSIVNILAGRRIVPELIQRDFRAENLVRETKELLFSEERKIRMKEEFRRIDDLLGEEKAAENVARELESMIWPRKS
ncbi:MAG: lipid-A-disaccharide synthase [Candidatus Aminicenantes bacterium]|nr:lipid-A-disaccharide synthase [Candidatus Aminicenantes bacterium]